MCRWRLYSNVMHVDVFVNSFYASNTYILSVDFDDGVWIVDVGDVSNIVEWLKTKGKGIKGVLLTHTHFDHIYGLNDLLSYDSCVKVYTCREGKSGLYSDKLNLSRYHDNPFVFRGKDVRLLDETSISLWPGLECRVYKTPGHDWSCLTYEINKNLFTGDSYIPNRRVVTSFPQSDKKDALKSLERITQMIKPGCKVWPGHGSVLTVV